MAEYYTKAESDAKYAATSHTHALESMGGNNLPADRVEVPESVCGSFNNAYTMDEALDSIATQFAGKAPANHTHTGYATADHSHTGFAAAEHTHSGYAPTEHTHSGYAAADHTHENYMSESDAEDTFAGIDHTHNYAPSGHTHAYADLTGKPTIPSIPSSLPANGGNADTVDGKHASDFATSGHTHTASDVGAAPASHTHTASEVGAAAANHSHTPASIGAAPASHSHSEYAAANHGHTGYADEDHTHTAADVGALSASGGTVNGALVVTGAGTIRGKAYTQQILPMDAGSYSIGASDNRYYSTYLRVNPNVSSDRRCKRDIAPMDIEALAAFVGKLSVVNYNYNDDKPTEAKRIGLIAQDVVAADPTIAQGCIEQDEKGFYSLRAADLVFPLIAAVQALTKRVEELEGK